MVKNTFYGRVFNRMRVSFTSWPLQEVPVQPQMQLKSIVVRKRPIALYNSRMACEYRCYYVSCSTIFDCYPGPYKRGPGPLVQRKLNP